jgi:hypothetical protein
MPVTTTNHQHHHSSHRTIRFAQLSAIHIVFTAKGKEESLLQCRYVPRIYPQLLRL